MEAHDEFAADMDQWKAMPPDQTEMHERIVEVARAMHDDLPLANEYMARRAAQRARFEGSTYSTKSDLDSRIRSILEDLISARRLADALGDPRSKRLVDALVAMPGSGL